MSRFWWERKKKVNKLLIVIIYYKRTTTQNDNNISHTSAVDARVGHLTGFHDVFRFEENAYYYIHNARACDIIIPDK